MTVFELVIYGCGYFMLYVLITAVFVRFIRLLHHKGFIEVPKILIGGVVMPYKIEELTGKQLLDVYFEGGFYVGNGEEQEFVEVDVIVDGTDWDVEHKHESSEVVFKYGNKFYRIYLTRWGSYWQGYEYDEPEGAEEVMLATRTVEYWRVI